MTDNSTNPSVRHVARVTLELKTPLHLGSGRSGDFTDAELVYDVNGLPAIPGSSIAGVLRSLYGKDSPEAEAIFGSSKENPSGKGSRLSVSWACIHDSHDRPVEGLIDPSTLSEDKVLKLARAPSLRDHVRITHAGVADAGNRGKFDEVSLQIGHRFTFEFELRGPAAQSEVDQAALVQLIEKINEPSFRLGGKTRRGFGAVAICRVATASFDLADDEERARYLKHPVSLAESSNELKSLSLGPSAGAQCFARLDLKANGFWMFGGGTDYPENTPHWSPVDMAPVRDTVIAWENGNRAKAMEKCFILPASSIKGALAHRTAFHYNCLAGRFIDPDTSGQEKLLAEYATNNPAIDALFGSSNDTDPDKGQRGHVIIDDSYLKPSEAETRRVPHVSIDRFTGGALDGALFDERPISGGGFPLEIYLDRDPGELEEKALEAFRRALRDLAEGRLALGAGGGRGNGFFEGQVNFMEVQQEKVSA